VAFVADVGLEFLQEGTGSLLEVLLFANEVLFAQLAGERLAFGLKFRADGGEEEIDLVRWGGWRGHGSRLEPSRVMRGAPNHFAVDLTLVRVEPLPSPGRRE
jgi:hypothetical protein